jgi:O-antigen/teichoic acid export membrane protein
MSKHSGTSLTAAAALSLLTNIISALAGLIIIPMVLRTLGPNQFGLFALQQTLTSLARGIDFGLPACATRAISIAKHNNTSFHDVRELTRKALLVAMTFTLLVIASSPLVANSAIADSASISTNAIFISLSLTAINCGTSSLSLYLQACVLGHPRTSLLYILRIAETASSFSCYLASTTYNHSLVLLTAAQLVVTATFLAAYYLLHRLQSNADNAPYVTKLEKNSADSNLQISLAVMNFVTVLSASADRLCLSIMLPLAEFGQYAIASQAVTAVFSVFSQAISSVFFPRISSLATTMPEKATPLLKLANLTAIAMSSASVCGFIIAGDAAILYWTKSPNLSRQMLTYLTTILSLSHSASTLSMTPLMLCIATGNLKGPLIASATGCIFCLSVLIPASYYLGAIGASIALLVAALLNLSILLPFANKHAAQPPVNKRETARVITTVACFLLWSVFSRYVIADYLTMEQRICYGSVMSLALIASFNASRLRYRQTM